MVLSQDVACGGSVAPLYLLLLPPAPRSLSRYALRDAFGKPIAEALKQLKFESSHATTGVRLDIAVPVQYLHENRLLPRSSLYLITEQLVASIYKIICIIAAKNNVNVEDAEGIDARVLLLAHPRNDGDQEHNFQAAANSLAGDVIDSLIDLKILAASRRPWKYVFAVDTEQGRQVLKEFLVCQDCHMKIRTVTGDDIARLDEGAKEVPREGNDERWQHHNSVAVGGTFDHIHIGHKLLLTMFAFLLSASRTAKQGERSLTVGITGDELLVNKKFAELLESWEARQRSVSAFLLAIMDFRPPNEAEVAVERYNNAGLNGHAVHLIIQPSFVIKCVEIGEPFGPTITDEAISALVVSGETRSGGKAVNEKRVEKQWSELEIFEVQVLDTDEGSSKGDADATFQNKISSTQIRQALRDRGISRSKV